MEIREPAERSAADRRGRRWGSAALFALVALLFILSYSRGRTSRVREQSDVARHSVETLVVARMAYGVFRPRNAGPVRPESAASIRERLISTHAEAVATDRSAGALRRLALCYYLVGDPAWRDALSRISTLPSPRSSTEVQRELALWAIALGGAPSPQQVREFRVAVARMNLGWYAHMALEAAYRNAGMEAEANEESRLANRSSGWMYVLFALGSFAGIGGVCICGFLFFRKLSTLRQYRPPISFIDRLLTPRAPWPLTGEQRGFLYYLFLSYLATMAGLRLLLSWLGMSSVLAGLAQQGPVHQVVITSVISLLPILPSVALFAIYGRRAEIPAKAIGFTSASWRADVVCGIGGYMAALPIVFLANIVSGTLFRNIETPVNPAISAFAGSGSGLYQTLIFIQAALLAPLIEETLFRGIFFQSLEHRLGGWRSALLASGVFGVLHPQLPLGFLGIFALGMVFNSLFILRRSLLPCMVAHAINNGAILLFLLTLTRG